MRVRKNTTTTVLQCTIFSMFYDVMHNKYDVISVQNSKATSRYASDIWIMAAGGRDVVPSFKLY